VVEDKSDSARLTALAAQLNEDNLSEIDFNAAVDQLNAIAMRLTTWEQMVQEIDVLRDDYQSRIAGMIKAMAVLKRSGDSVGSASEEIAGLAELTAEELVRTYRRTMARFRDHFPASYGPPTSVAGRTIPGSIINLFK